MRVSLIEFDEGSVTATTRVVGGFRISDLTFPPRLELAPHGHERPSLSIVVAGSLAKTFRKARFRLSAASAVTLPAEAWHVDAFEREGARTLAVELEQEAHDLFGRPAALNRVREVRGARLESSARRIAAELHATDAVAALALEGLVLELLAAVVRFSTHRPVGRRPPAWLAAVEEVLHHDSSRPVRIADLARAANVHPVHLARVFRASHGVSLGRYARELRLDWAAAELLRCDESLAGVAARAGFADQSHFTRAFKRHVGVTPARYRRLLRAEEAR